MNRQKLWSRFFLAASLLTAALIFYFSAQKGDTSQVLSDSITLQVAQILKPQYTQLPPEQQLSYLELLSTIIRKNAHFCEFALLGFNLMCYFSLQNPRRGALHNRLLAWGTATLYAATDELHQLFVSARNAAVVDVLIDSAGSLTGTLVATLFLLLLRRWTEK